MSASARSLLTLAAAACAGVCLSVTASLLLHRKYSEATAGEGSGSKVMTLHHHVSTSVGLINCAGSSASSSGAETSNRTASEDERGTAVAEKARRGLWDEDLSQEQLARNAAFLGDDGLKKVRGAFVIIVGLGGVGSHVASSLARSGVGKLRLIDFDQVSLSSLNRHSVATLCDVGSTKVKCLQKRLEQVAPWVRFDLRNELYQKESSERLLEPWIESDGSEGQKASYVVDAIDSIDTKVELLFYCSTNHIPVISSMGAGCKSDPTRLLVGDISATIEDPLSRAVRIRLRKLGVESGIPCVFSSEQSGIGKPVLLPISDEEANKGSVNELAVAQNFRVRILPVISPLPAIFGLSIANHILLDVAGRLTNDYVPYKNKRKMWDGMLSKLQASEERLVRQRYGATGTGVKLGFNVSDVGLICEEVFRGRSVISGATSKLALVRWIQSDNLVAPGSAVAIQHVSSLVWGEVVQMTQLEAAMHEREVLLGSRKLEELYDTETLARVDRRLRETVDIGIAR